MKYTLGQDDSCHWYVFPTSKGKEFDDWVDASDPEVPEFAIRIDTPYSISFDAWESHF